MNIGSKVIDSQQSVKLLCIEINSRLNFDERIISTLSQKVSSQLNALCRPKSFLKQDGKNVTANSFIFTNFSYCPLIWHFCSQRSMKKIENIQKRVLRSVFNDHVSNYEVLLSKTKTCTMRAHSFG